MAFDWIRFLDSNHIEYSTKGANVSRGNIVVHCPWCGHEDEGTHLSVALNGRGYRCFRQPDRHRGKANARLVAALLGCSLEQAAKICGEQIYIPEDFMARVTDYINPKRVDSTKQESLRMPLEFRRFSTMPSCRPYETYLLSRGFREIYRFTELLDVRYCTSGFFHHRVMFPVRHEGKLMTFTGRSLDPQAPIRYLTLPTAGETTEKYGLQPALGPITDYLLWFDECAEADADTIYIVEGPMDAMKIWELGLDYGIVAVCVFTATASAGQIDKLHDLLPKFKNRFLMLDRDTLAVSMRLNAQLSGLGVINRILPLGVKDPGELKNAKFLQP